VYVKDNRGHAVWNTSYEEIDKDIIIQRRFSRKKYLIGYPEYIKFCIGCSYKILDYSSPIFAQEYLHVAFIFFYVRMKILCLALENVPRVALTY